MIKYNKDKHYGVIYIRIFPNDKYYIGATVQNPKERWWHQNSDAKIYKKNTILLYNALKKYNYKTLNYVLDIADNKEELFLKEEEYIRIYDSTNPNRGYNILEKAGTPLLLSSKYKGENHPAVKISDKKCLQMYDLRFKDEKNIKDIEKIVKIDKKTIEAIINFRKRNYLKNVWLKSNISFKDINLKSINKKIHNRELSITSQRKNGLFGCHGYNIIKHKNNKLGTRRCFRSRIQFNKHKTSLGVFEDPLSAQIVYDLVWNEVYQ